MLWKLASASDAAPLAAPIMERMIGESANERWNASEATRPRPVNCRRITASPTAATDASPAMAVLTAPSTTVAIDASMVETTNTTPCAIDPNVCAAVCSDSVRMSTRPTAVSTVGPMVRIDAMPSAKPAAITRAASSMESFIRANADAASSVACAVCAACVASAASRSSAECVSPATARSSPPNGRRPSCAPVISPFVSLSSASRVLTPVFWAKFAATRVSCSNCV